MKLITTLTLSLLAATFIGRAAIAVPQASPYTPDANTVLLEHFDNSVTGSVSGPLTYTSGIFSQSGNFSTTTALTWSSPALAQGTFEFWASIASYDSDSVQMDPYVRLGFAHYSGIPAAETLYIDIGRSPQLHSPMFGLNAAPFNWNDVQPISPVGLNEWHHYAVTWGTAGMHFYLDGGLVASNSDTRAINPSTQIWGLGSRSGYNEGLTGQVDEFRLSNIQREFTAVPEPSAVALLLSAALLCLRRRTLRTHERIA